MSDAIGTAGRRRRDGALSPSHGPDAPRTACVPRFALNSRRGDAEPSAAIAEASAWASPEKRVSVLLRLCVRGRVSIRRRGAAMRRSIKLSLIVLCAGVRWPSTLVFARSRADQAGAATRRRAVPAPKDVFGFQVGADYKLASHEQLLDYFAKLDASSDRIVVDPIGKSSEGAADDRRGHLQRSQPEKPRALPGDRATLAFARGVERTRSAGAGEGRQSRSSGSTAACTPPKSPARSTRRSWRGGWCRQNPTRRNAFATTRSSC